MWERETLGTGEWRPHPHPGPTDGPLFPGLLEKFWSQGQPVGLGQAVLLHPGQRLWGHADASGGQWGCGVGGKSGHISDAGSMGNLD